MGQHPPSPAHGGESTPSVVNLTGEALRLAALGGGVRLLPPSPGVRLLVRYQLEPGPWLALGLPVCPARRVLGVSGLPPEDPDVCYVVPPEVAWAAAALGRSDCYAVRPSPSGPARALVLMPGTAEGCRCELAAEARPPGVPAVIHEDDGEVG
jgi:hypothetical protein